MNSTQTVVAMEFINCPHCIELSQGYTRQWPRRATPEQRAIIYYRDGGRCHYCKAVLDPNSFHADHKIAWLYSRNTDLSNLVAACRMCNIAKHTLSYDRYKRLLTQNGIGWRNRKYFATYNKYRHTSTTA